MKTNTRRELHPTLLSAVVAASLSGVCGSASAAFFQIQETSTSGLGQAYAGAAALADDASTVWHNPAGLTHLPGSQIVVGGHYIDPSFDAKNVTASAVTTVPISGGGGEAGESAFVPNLYFSQQLSDRLTFGLGINAPFGLSTDYNDGWAGRYHTDRSHIESVNVNPSLGWKLNDQLSLGAGVNYQRLKAELTQAVDFATICTVSGLSGVCGAGAGFNPNTNPNDGHASVTADDTAWGYNFGAQWQLADTRVGLAYRSSMKFKLSGDFDVTAPSNVPGALLTGGGLVDSGMRATVTLPATASVSAMQHLNSEWAVMGDVTRTFWSRLSELRIQFDSTQPDSVVTLNLKDVNRYSLGTRYAPGGGAWSYRAGLALDESPVPNERDRTPRLPDSDRLWYTLGAGYQHSERLSFDVGLAYITLKDASVRKTTADSENTVRGNLSADYTGDVKILSAQMNWKF